MSSSSGSRKLEEQAARLDALADDYARRLRGGEDADMSEYVARHPDLAEELRSILPAVRRLEEADPLADSVHRTRIGDYRIERELGRGGMGVVYSAVQESLGRRVALKLLPVRATLDARFLERFRREVRAAARLQHPGIVPVYGAGTDEELHYFAMQYVDGPGLDRVLARVRGIEAGRDDPTDPAEPFARMLLDRELTGESVASSPAATGSTSFARARKETYFRNVARIGLRAANALAYAHGRGVLHRDVKPGNLLLDASGAVWVSDFGLAKLTDGDDVTETDGWVGTLRTMAPEQFQGRADVRSDVYGLGITLYELLTRRRAFGEASRPELVRRVLHDSPKRPRRIDPDVPRELESIVLKATAKLPDERYGTADAMAQDLRAWLAGRPIAARPPSLPYLARLALRRNPVATAVVGGALAILLVATAAFVLNLRKAWSEQGRQLALANLAAVEAAVQGSDVRLARERLDAIPARRRDWEWRHFAARLDDSLRRVASVDEYFSAVAYGPGERFLVASHLRPARLHLWDPAEASGRSFAEAYPQDAHFLALGPDGEWVATASDRGVVQIRSLRDDCEVLGQRRFDSHVHALTVDPSGGRIAIGLSDSSIRVVDSLLRSEVAVLEGHTGPARALAFDGEGRTLASGADDGTVRVWDVESTASIVLAGHREAVRGVAIDADGRLVASASEDGTARLWDATTGRARHLLVGHTEAVSDVELTPDGRWAVTASHDRTLRVWDVDTGRHLRTLRGHRERIVDLAVGASGQRALSTSLDGTLREWDLRAAGGDVRLYGHVRDVWAARFDPSGRRIATGGRDTTLRVWDAVTGRVLRLFDAGGFVVACDWSADGTLVAAGGGSGLVRVWDVESCRLVAEIADRGPRANGVRGLAFRGDELLVGRADGSLEAWDVRRGGHLVRSASAPLPQHDLVLDPTGEFLAVFTTRFDAADGTIHLLRADDFSEVRRLEGHEDIVFAVAFDPTGRSLGSVSRDRTIALWDVGSGELRRRLRPEASAERAGRVHVRGIAFSPDGARMLTASTNRVLRVWDPVRGDEIVRLRSHAGSLDSVAFAPDGDRVATFSSDGEVRVWDALSSRARTTELEREARREAEASALVQELRARLGSAGAVVAELGADGSRDPELREAALSLASLAAGTPSELATTCAAILAEPAADDRALFHANMLADCLCRSDLSDERFNTLDGIACFRRGRYAKACRRLEAARSARAEASAKLSGYLALTYIALGREADARAELSRARAADDAAAQAALLTEVDRTLSEDGPR